MPRMPLRGCVEDSVPAAGCLNAAGFRNLLPLLSGLIELSPYGSSSTCSARCVPCWPLSAMSAPVETVSHGPVSARKPPTSRQSENAARIAALSSRGDWTLAGHREVVQPIRRAVAIVVARIVGLVVADPRVGRAAAVAIRRAEAVRQRVVRRERGQRRGAAHREQHAVVALAAVAHILIQLPVEAAVVRILYGERPSLSRVGGIGRRASARHGDE